MTSSDKETKLRARMAALGISEEDLEENFIRGSGPGGQKINKTSSCVQLLHRPSGIDIRCQRERSRTLNRLIAREELCDRLQARARRDEASRRARIAKRRRQAAKRSPATKKKILESKRRRSQAKKLRSRPRADE